MVRISKALIVSLLMITSAYRPHAGTKANSAEDLPPGKIVRIGQDTYKIRVIGELIEAADRRATNLASEFCSRMKQAMVVKDRAFDMGYGYRLTWSCVSPQQSPINH